MMSQPVSGSDCAPPPRRTRAISPLRVFPALAALGAALLAGSPAHAQQRIFPVHFWTAGHVVPLKTSPVSNGVDTLLPVSAIPAIGARTTLNTAAGTVRVTLKNGRSDSLPYVRRSGVAMINIADLAETADGYVIKPVATPAPGLQPYTVYLLAHVTDVHLQGNALHISTSFPVPFSSRTLTGTPPRGYVDCIGAVVARGFRPVGIPVGQQRAARLRVGQFSPDVARVVVDLAPGVTLETNSTGGRVSPTYIATLTGAGRIASGGRLPSHRTGDYGTGSSSGNDNAFVLPRSHRNTDTTTGDSSDTWTPERNRGGSNPPETVLRPHRSTPRNPGGSASTPSGMTEVRSISYDTPDSQTIQIFIETNRKAKAYVRYSATTRQVILDIPNSRLNLDDDRQKDQDISHPLIQGLVAETVQNSPRIPPLTRLTLDAPRVVSTAVDSQPNQIVLDITVPQTSVKRSNKEFVRLSRQSGISPKLVVVDAGHGGALTGATGRNKNHVVYEKDIALAIASRLRTALEAHGTRVVMTRVQDVNVPLEDRPRIANEVGANVFVSIHNDSWGKADSITGTSTYFHNQNAQSRELARCIQKELAGVGLRNRGIVSDVSLYPGGLCVLRDTNMPAVLCEVGYINNPKDRSRLMNAEFQQRVAEAVCTGVRNFAASGSHTLRRHKKSVPVA